MGLDPTLRALGVISSDDPQRLAVLVHEVRSPVAALSAIAETFVDEDLEGSARLELSRLAIAACSGIERVVVDAAVASLHLQEVDVGALIRQVAATATLSGARVEAAVAPDLRRITVDPLRLRQALDNLLANALKHAGSGDVVMSALEHEVHVLMSVSDSGAGVPVADQERIFDAGVQLDPDRAGSGLGLAITRAIAEAHGGSLTVKSTPGKGATFTIAIPLR